VGDVILAKASHLMTPTNVTPLDNGAAAPAVMVGTIDMAGFCRSRETSVYAHQHFAEPLFLPDGVEGVTRWT
jgi:hypothetical protein